MTDVDKNSISKMESIKHEDKTIFSEQIPESRKEKEKEVFSNGEIQQLKGRLEKLNPQKLIEEAMKFTKKNEEKRERKDEFLENLKSNSVKIFLDNIKNKSLREVNQEFENKIDEYNKASLLYKDKIDKENAEYKSLNLASRQKIEQLETTVIQYNQENTILNEQIKSTTKTLDKLQLKFSDFEKYKPIFEQFYKEFPDDDPVKIIQDIKIKKEASIKIIEESNEFQRKIIILEKEKKEIQESSRRTIEELTLRITKLERENQFRADEYIKEIKQLQQEVLGMKNYKTENENLKFMLFQLYNHLIERLKMDRNIKLDPSLEVKEKDFTPNLYDNIDIIRYIKAMLNTSSEEKSAQILREVTAYSNMMLRNFMKDKLQNKWNPVQIFKDIKDLIETLQLDNHTYQQTNIRLNNKIKELDLQIHKQEKEIKYKILLYENLEKKYAEQFDEKIKRLRGNRLKTKQKNKIEIDENKPNEEHSKSKEKSIDEIATGEMNKSNLDDSKKDIVLNPIRPSTAVQFKSNKKEHSKEIFVTTGKRPITSNTLRPMTSKSRGISASTRPQTGKSNIIPKNVKSQNSFTLTYMLKQQQKIARSENEINAANHYNEDNITPIKNLKMSKNNDKLLIPGKFNLLENHREGLINLVDNTNKLFLVKERTRPYSMRSEGDNNMFNKFKKHIDSNLKKLDKISNKMNKVNERNDDIQNLINTNIDCLIKNLEVK